MLSSVCVASYTTSAFLKVLVKSDTLSCKEWIFATELKTWPKRSTLETSSNTYGWFDYISSTCGPFCRRLKLAIGFKTCQVYNNPPSLFWNWDYSWYQTAFSCFVFMKSGQALSIFAWSCFLLLVNCIQTPFELRSTNLTGFFEGSLAFSWNYLLLLQTSVVLYWFSNKVRYDSLNVCWTMIYVLNWTIGKSLNCCSRMNYIFDFIRILYKFVSPLHHNCHRMDWYRRPRYYRHRMM